MKNIVHAALVAFTLAASAAFAQTTQEVTGNVLDSISLSAASSSTAIALAPGATNTVGNTLTVSATKAFTIKAKGDMSHMTQHDGTSYVTSGKTLATAPSIDAAVSGGATFEGTTIASLTLGTTDATIFNGDESVENGSVSTTLSQPVSYNDDVLTTTGHKYRVVITYTAALNP